MSIELAEKIILGMNSKARIDELTARFGEEVKKAFDLLLILGLIEIKDGSVIITEKGEMFKELPSV
jgi:predicted methyltransferase